MNHQEALEEWLYFDDNLAEIYQHAVSTLLHMQDTEIPEETW